MGKEENARVRCGVGGGAGADSDDPLTLKRETWKKLSAQNFLS
jgi:hypothetical protein